MILLALATSYPSMARGQAEPPSSQPPIPYRWDAPGRACILDGPGLKAAAVAFSPDGSTLLVGYEDGSIRRHDARSGKPAGPAIETRRHRLHGLAISPDGDGIAVASPAPNVFMPYGVITIRRPGEAEIGEPLRIPGQVIALAYAADGKTIGAIDHLYNIRVWRLDDRSEVASSEDRPHADGRRPESAESRANFSADLKRAAIVNAADVRFKEGRWNHVIRLWEAGAKEQRIVGDREGFERLPITGALISPDGSRFVEAHEHQYVFFHEFTSDRLLHGEFPQSPTGGDLTFLMLSPDNRRFISATKEGYGVVEDLNDKLNGRRGFHGPRGYVRAAAIVPGGVRLATGGWDPLGAQKIPGKDWPKHEPVLLWEVKVDGM